MSGERWQIHIEYHTGDSFNSYETEDDISLIWDNLDVAKQALQRIKDWHYREEYEEHPEWWTAFDANRPIPPERVGIIKDYDCCAMMLPMDDGSEHQVHTFWRGHFERLISAKIVPYVDVEATSDMEFIP